MRAQHRSSKTEPVAGGEKMAQKRNGPKEEWS